MCSVKGENNRNHAPNGHTWDHFDASYTALCTQQQSCQQRNMPKAGKADLVVPVVKDRKNRVRICIFLVCRVVRCGDFYTWLKHIMGLDFTIFSTIFAFAILVLFSKEPHNRSRLD